MKCLCYRNDKGGFALSWIQEWLKLDNAQILEGHNMIFGRHSYLFYQKHKYDNLFKHHILRNSLHSTWQQYVK